MCKRQAAATASPAHWFKCCVVKRWAVGRKTRLTRSKVVSLPTDELCERLRNSNHPSRGTVVITHTENTRPHAATE
jgi:hypothetical protein